MTTTVDEPTTSAVEPVDEAGRRHVASEATRPGIFEDKLWDVSARVIAVVGLALPLLGYCVRYLSLGIQGAPADLALAVSVPEAAFVGVWPAVAALALLVLLLRFDVIGARKARRQERHRIIATGWRRWLFLVVAVVAALALLPIAALFVLAGVAWFEAQPANALPMLPFTLLAVRSLRPLTLSERPVSLRSVSPGAAYLLVAVVAATVLGPVAIRHLAYVSFTPDSGMSSGWYADVGASEGLLYLRSCLDPPSVVTGVPLERVAANRLLPRPPTARIASVGEIIQGRIPISDPCDDLR